VWKDAIKCGFNAPDDVTEVNWPAQDYRMISDFTYQNALFGSIVNSCANVVSKAVTNNTTGTQDPVWKVPSVGSTTQAYVRPFYIDHYVFNPSNSTICLDVEVYCWRRGFMPSDQATMPACYYNGIDADNMDIEQGTAFLQGDPFDPSITLNVRQQIHGVSFPGNTVATNNAQKTFEQIMHLKKLRLRAIKLLSRRRCVAIPPGGIYHFKIKMRYPGGFPTDAFLKPSYAQYMGNERMVILRWNTQMGTVASALESSHMSEKVHIVLGRRFCLKGHIDQRVPDLKVQMATQHDGVFPVGTNYIGTPVAEHLQLMQVTKSAQQVETVP